MKRKKRGFSLRNEYRESWNYLKESRKFIYIVVGVFFVFALIGFFVPLPNFFAEKILEFVRQLLEETGGMNLVELINFIFFNNLQSSFLGMILGFALGIFPLLVAIVNGCLLGFVSKVSVAEEGIFVLWRLLPHGVFELLALFISLGLGLKFGTFVFQKNKSKSFRKYFWNSLRVFLFVVMPLLILAAIIESFLVYYLG